MFKRAVQTIGRHLFSSPAGTTLHNNIKSCNFRLLSSSTRFQLTSLYSTLPSAQNPHSPADASDSVQPQTEKEISSDVVEDVSNEEFKELIHKYDTGDENALPSIFEAILKRKLYGKHDESDEELMDELGIKTRKYHSDIEIDENAVNSIFEDVLKRKLYGKHDESDEELMDELGIKTPKYHSDIEIEDDIEDDIEELHSADDEESGD